MNISMLSACCFCLIPTPFRVLCLGNGVPTVGWGLLTSVTNYNNPPQTSPQVNTIQTLLQLRVPFQMILGCGKLTLQRQSIIGTLYQEFSIFKVIIFYYTSNIQLSGKFHYWNDFCIRYFFSIASYPEKSNIKENGFILAYTCRETQSIMIS